MTGAKEKAAAPTATLNVKPSNGQDNKNGTDLSRKRAERIANQALAAEVKIGEIGNEPLFDLCQRLRGAFSEKTPACDLYSAFKNFYGGHSHLSRKYQQDEAWLMFEDIWDGKKVKWPKIPYFQIAVDRAKKQTEPRPEMLGCDNEKLCLLAQVCFELQGLTQGKPFSISQYQAAEILSISSRMGRLLLDKLERQGVLKLCKTGNYKKKLANTYSYATSNVSYFTANRDYL